MIYVLIILGMGWGSGSSTAEFNGKEACEVASAAVKAIGQMQTAVCVPKGAALISGAAT